MEHAATLVAIVLSGAVAWVVGELSGSGRVEWVVCDGIVLLALAVTALCYAVARRWSTARGLRVGALIVWLVIALALAIRVPGTSYLFTWPLLFAAVAALVTRGREVADWATAIVTIFILVGFFYGVSVVMLGVTGAGAIALGVAASLILLLLAPLLDLVAGGARWSGAPWLAGAGALLLLPLSRCIRTPTIPCVAPWSTQRMPTRVTRGLARLDVREMRGRAVPSACRHPELLPSGQHVSQRELAHSPGERSRARRSLRRMRH